MGLSLGQGVFHITASTSEYEKQMGKCERLQSQLANEDKRYTEQSEASARKLANFKISSAERINKKEKELLEQQKRVDELAAKVVKAEQTGAKNLLKLKDQLVRANNKLEASEIAVQKARQQQADTIANLEKRQLNLTEKNAEKVAKLRKEIEKSQLAAKKSQGVLNKLSSGLKSGLGSIIGGVGVAATVSYFDQGATKLDGLAKRARDVGMTASQLQELEHQAKLAGMETGNLDSAVKTFNKNISLAGMGTGKAKDAIAEMGISLKDANGVAKTQDELLKEVALKFSETAGSAENAGLATKIFGDNGAEMLRIFEQGEGVINKVFNANGIDEAAAAAERYKDNLENIQNAAFKVSARVIEGWSLMADAIFGDGIAEEAYKREEKAWNEKIKRQKKAQEDARKAEEARIAKVKKSISDVDARIAKSEEKLKSQEEQIIALKARRQKIQSELTLLDKNSEEYAKSYAVYAEISLELRKQEKALAEATAKEIEKQYNAEIVKRINQEIERLKERERIKTEAYNNAKKRLDDLEARRKGQAENKAEYEYELKLQLLRRQGKDAQADALEQARKRNELMEKYGYSIEQANKMLKIQKELANPPDKEVEYSEEDIKRAKRIVESGKGGKTTQAEAQAILEGKKVEGGFKSATFQNTEGKEVKDKLRNVNVDAKATKKNLDNDAKKIQEKNNQNIDALKDEVKGLKSILEDIKNGINSMAIKKGNNYEAIRGTLGKGLFLQRIRRF